MLRSFCVIALVVANLAASGQFAEKPPNTGDKTTFTLQGTVVNSATGRPIRRALVEVYSGGPRAMLTNPEGEFSFDNILKGAVMVRAHRPGFTETAQSGQAYSLKSVEIGPQTGKIVLKLTPECMISGTVLDSNGEPIEGATIDVVTSSIVEGRRELVPVHAGIRTDEDGSFRMSGLSSGKYFINVEAGANRLIAQSKNEVRSYPAKIYYPFANDISSATPLNLAPGEHAQVQFSLPLVAAFKLSGTVFGISGYKEVAPPILVDGMDQFLFSARRWDRETGAFEFPAVPAGTYILRVYAQSEDKHPAWLRQSVIVNRDISGLNVGLQSGSTIPVSVRAELSPQSLPSNCAGGFMGQNGKTDCKIFLAMVMLMPLDSTRTQFRAEPESEDPSTLAIRGVTPGKYRVDVMPMVSSYVRSVRCGGVDLLREELTVPAGGSMQPIEVVLRDDGAIVKVHVQGEPVEHVKVLFLPEFAPYLRPRVIDVNTKEDGMDGGLAPGEYKVLAFDSMDGIEYANPEFLGKYSSQTVHVTLSANSTTTLNVDVIHTGE
jgi:hypothetical protein